MFPLESRTQYAEWLCRKIPWQPHMQSLVILFEKKISLPLPSYNFLKRHYSLDIFDSNLKTGAAQFLEQYLIFGAF